MVVWFSTGFLFFWGFYDCILYSCRGVLLQDVTGFVGVLFR